MKKIILLITPLIFVTPAHAFMDGGGGVGINIPITLPPSVPEIDGDNVRAFWECFFDVSCRAFEMQFDDEEE